MSRPRQTERAAPRGGRRADIRDVAKRAGVSVASVSRAVNGLPSVDAEIARRVWTAVRELGYRPNAQARALVSGRSRLFGVIISDITNPFFPELIQSFEEIAARSSYEILIGSTSHDPDLMERCIERMLERSVEGVAVMTFGFEQPLLDRLASHRLPLVFIDEAPHAEGMSTLSVDYAQGIGEAVQHLAVLGHRRIGFIAGPAGLRSADLRRDAFSAAIQAIGLPPHAEFMVHGDHTPEGGTRAMEALLARPIQPTAVMCSNDMMAIGVLHAAADAGLRVPDDLSVIGFDDIHIARYTIPPLSSVQMSCQDLAGTAFNALRAFVEKDFASWRSDYSIPTRLKLRRSTSIPRGALADLHPVPPRQTPAAAANSRTRKPSAKPQPSKTPATRKRAK